MAFSGHVILIVEPELLPFVGQLQDAIEAERGDSVVARDPSTASARCRQFQFTAALVNVRHRDMVGKLIMPAMLYDPKDGLATVVVRLKKLLSLRGPN